MTRPATHYSFIQHIKCAGEVIDGAGKLRVVHGCKSAGEIEGGRALVVVIDSVCMYVYV
jgi:hypothetical protein